LALLVFTSGCPEDASNMEDASPPDASLDANADADSEAPPPRPDAGDGPQTYTLQSGPHTVESGVEQTLCMTLDLGNSAPGMIRSIRPTLSPGSHHMIIQRAAVDEPRPVPTPCGAFTHGDELLFIAQQANAGIDYPDGVGLAISANQLISIEMHFINYVSADPIDITGMVEFDVVPADDSLEPVNVSFLGPFGFSLPPRERSTVQSMQRLPPGDRIFALTTHTHQLGVEATLERVGDGEPTLLHRSTNWAEPPMDIFDPPLVLNSGEEIRLTCVYENTTDETVGFGTNFEDEMCFFWAYTY